MKLGESMQAAAKGGTTYHDETRKSIRRGGIFITVVVALSVCFAPFLLNPEETATEWRNWRPSFEGASVTSQEVTDDVPRIPIEMPVVLEGYKGKKASILIQAGEWICWNVPSKSEPYLMVQLNGHGVFVPSKDAKNFTSLKFRIEVPAGHPDIGETVTGTYRHPKKKKCS